MFKKVNKTPIEKIQDALSRFYDNYAYSDSRISIGGSIINAVDTDMDSGYYTIDSLSAYTKFIEAANIIKNTIERSSLAEKEEYLENQDEITLQLIMHDKVVLQASVIERKREVVICDADCCWRVEKEIIFDII